MNQLSFYFGEPAYPRFDQLLGHANAELIHMLQQDHAPFLYIWGEEGSGKSHILKAWVGQAATAGRHARYIDALHDTLDEDAAQADCLAVDRADRLGSRDQAVLFDIFNRFRNSGRGKLLLAAQRPPAALQLREDLRTRMGYCLVYEVRQPDGEEKIDALVQLARARQLAIDPAIFRYLLDHWRRDMDSLLAMFDDLADYSAATHKPITLPLLRRLLKQQEEQQPENPKAA